MKQAIDPKVLYKHQRKQDALKKAAHERIGIGYAAFYRLILGATNEQMDELRELLAEWGSNES